MEISYIAQSGFAIKAGDLKLLIDPWLSNPINPHQSDSFLGFDYVMLTHDHQDHGLDDVKEIMRKSDKTKLITNYELANSISDDDITNVIAANIGGWLSLNDDRIDVQLTNALHSSEVGVPTGFIFEVEGKTIYHLGDTGYMSEFSYYAEKHDFDLVFVPIGGHFTMDVEQAVDAVKVLKPKKVVPVHYDTFPLIEADVEGFKEKVELETDTKVEIIRPGESLEV